MSLRLYQNAVDISHNVLASILCPGDIVLDGTAGNGNDTVFLANLVGKTGKVYAFDIQEEALKKTKEKIINLKIHTHLELIQDGHENLDKYITSPIKAAVFNLGYLPGGNKKIITKPESTVLAVQKAMCFLCKKGVISLVIYTGHPGGLEEWEALKMFLCGLPQSKYDVLTYNYLNRHNCCPFLVIIQSLTSPNIYIGG
ncbi:class I SAM-dependent methyltransferase [Bacillota bacterium LX-D]|nr:class I SAM-dependent methyltransferase [Bacillota bacterium LX-D]